MLLTLMAAPLGDASNDTKALLTVASLLTLTVSQQRS